MKAAVILGSTGILLSGAIAPAMAETAESTVSGGSLGATTAGATLAGVTLNGFDQSVTGPSSEWTITDARGTGAAWTLSAMATAPTSAAGTTIDKIARVIPVDNLTITPGTITAGEGSDPASSVTAPTLKMSGSTQTLVSGSPSSTSQSKGTYTLTPTFSLTIPANAYRSNWNAAVDTGLIPYISTITFTIA